MSLKTKAILIFIALSLAYLLYSVLLYQKQEKRLSDFNHGNPLKGKQVWQNYNCQSCHQIYGLGGYLGPDLTNVVSKYHHNKIALKGVIESGNASMPAYAMPPEEIDALLDFLTYMDQTGNASPRSFKRLPNGMIE